MSDTIISAKDAYESTHKNIARTFDKINTSIQAAINTMEFTCSVYLTEAEYQFALPYFEGYKVTKLERSGSMTYKYQLDFSENSA